MAGGHHSEMDCCDILRSFPNLNDVGAGVRLLKIPPFEVSFFLPSLLPPSPTWGTGAHGCMQTFGNSLGFFPSFSAF